MCDNPRDVDIFEPGVVLILAMAQFAKACAAEVDDFVVGATVNAQFLMQLQEFMCPPVYGACVAEATVREMSDEKVQVFRDRLMAWVAEGHEANDEYAWAALKALELLITERVGE
jgi:hypothetical protein